MRRRAAVAAAAGTIAIVLSASPAGADIIMTAADLSERLKAMETLTHTLDTAKASAQRDEATFDLALRAHDLVVLMNQEVASHGMEERALLDQAVSRARTYHVVILPDAQNAGYRYDGEGFRTYLAHAPAGVHAALAEFLMLQDQFEQLKGADTAALEAAAAKKTRFLARYPAFEQNADLRMYLAIDYRDLYRHSRDAGAPVAAARYRRATRDAYLAVEQHHPGTPQAAGARELLRRFDLEASSGGR